MEKKFTQIDEKGARTRKGKDGHVVDNYQVPSEKGGHTEIHHNGKTYTASGKTGTDIRNRNAQAHHYVAKEKIDDKKSKYHGQEVEKSLWVNQLGRVIEEDMKAFSEITEDTIHLAPHGDKGTHYKVVKGVHTLKKGDVLHDSEVDDLRDHYKIKHLKEDEVIEEGGSRAHVGRKDMQTRESAADRHAYHVGRLEALHKHLGKRIERMKSEKNPHWGHVGSAEQMANDIRSAHGMDTWEQ